MSARAVIAAITLVASAMVSGCGGASAAPQAPSAPERVVHVEAQTFEFIPDTVTLTQGEPVILELVTRDRAHGFDAPDLGVRADIVPGKVTRVRVVPPRAGTFTFHCDVFCGDGHEAMGGRIVVVERR